jgi:hypothetical protein
MECIHYRRQCATKNGKIKAASIPGAAKEEVCVQTRQTRKYKRLGTFTEPELLSLEDMER